MRSIKKRRDTIRQFPVLEMMNLQKLQQKKIDRFCEEFGITVSIGLIAIVLLGISLLFLEAMVRGIA